MQVPIEINCVHLFNEFGAKAFCSLIKGTVKTENTLPIFAVEGVINSEIL